MELAMITPCTCIPACALFANNTALILKLIPEDQFPQHICNRIHLSPVTCLLIYVPHLHRSGGKAYFSGNISTSTWLPFCYLIIEKEMGKGIFWREEKELAHKSDLPAETDDPWRCDPTVPGGTCSFILGDDKKVSCFSSVNCALRSVLL